MLILSRHRDESVTITAPDGTRLVVRVIDIRSDKVRIGFEAPAEYGVNRSEVQARIDGGEPRREAMRS